MPRCGVVPKFSDLEVIALSMTQETMGYDSECYLFGQLEDYRSKLPYLISRRQYNDRRKFTAALCEEIRKRVAEFLDGGEDVFIIDSKPDDAPIFPDVWAQIEPLIEGLPLVAHNKAFDEGCLKVVFRTYQMDYPDYLFLDTLWASRRKLPDLPNHQLDTVASACGFQMENHHHALADAEACAHIALHLL